MQEATVDFPEYKAYVFDHLTDRMAPFYQIEEEIEKMCWNICKPFYKLEVIRCPENRSVSANPSTNWRLSGVQKRDQYQQTFLQTGGYQVSRKQISICKPFYKLEVIRCPENRSVSANPSTNWRLSGVLKTGQYLQTLLQTGGYQVS